MTSSADLHQLAVDLSATAGDIAAAISEERACPDAAVRALDLARTLAADLADGDGDLLEQILSNADEAWGPGEAAAEEIAVGYVRHLEAVKAAAADMLSRFAANGSDGHHARVGQVQVQRWTRLLEATCAPGPMTS